MKKTKDKFPEYHEYHVLDIPVHLLSCVAGAIILECCFKMKNNNYLFWEKKTCIYLKNCLKKKRSHLK